MTLAEPNASLSPGITRPVIVALWTYAASYVPWLAVRLAHPIPAWVMPVLGVAAGLIGMQLARNEWSPRVLDRRLSEWASVLSGATGLAMGAWFYYATIADPLHVVMWLALGSLPLGGWYWTLHRSVALYTAAVTSQAAAGVTPMTLALTTPSDPEWTAVLEEAGLPGVHVQRRDTAAGVTLTVTPNREKRQKAEEVAQKAKDIAACAAFAHPEIELREDDVRVEPGARLPLVLVHISWKRPLRGTLPYVPAGAPGDIREARPLGIDEVGEVVAAQLGAQNGLTVSETGGGKTVETNVKIARITECTNALVWIGATDKLLPLVYPWILPWLSGRTDRPVIDWVAGQRGRDVLDMLADVYCVVRERNARNARRSKHTPTPDSPSLVVFIEESTDLARRRDKVRTYDGYTWTASALIERICAADRSASVSLYFLAQAALVDALGDHGSAIMRNIRLRTCGKTMSTYDGTASLVGLRGNVDTVRLRDNTMLIQPNMEEPRIFPWKAYYLEDDHMIEPVVIANTRHRPVGIEPEIAAQLTSYAGRWDDGRLPDIVRECDAEGFAWPGTRGAAPPDDEGDGDLMTAARTTGLRDAFDVTETVDKIRALTASLDARILPEPLDAVAYLLDAESAPTEFVSSAKLAIVLGRVAPDASDDEIDRAGHALARELASAAPALVAAKVQRGVAPGRKARGYDVPKMRAVIEAMRRGEVVPSEEVPAS